MNVPCSRTLLLFGSLLAFTQVLAEGPTAEELARKAQDPLADTKAIMTDNTITYSWQADSGNRWQVPLGLTWGRTMPLGIKGDALDLSLGAYSLVEKPEGGADWQLKFGISWFLP